MLTRMREWLGALSSVGPVVLFAAGVYYWLNNLWDWKAQALVWGGAVLILAYVVANFGRLRVALKTRRVRYGSAAGLTVLLVAAILGLTNFLNFRHHLRTDLTDSQLFALSDQSRKIVKNLQSEIEVIGFFQDEPGARGFEDLMKEYVYHGSKVEYEVVDPQKDPGKVSQFDVRRNGQVVVVSEGKTEIVEEATEEKITNAIIRVTRKREKRIYFLQGHGERDIHDTSAQGFSAVREGLKRQNYKIDTYNLAQENQFPKDAAVIVSAGPQVNFFPTEVKLLKEYLSAGGTFLLLVDPKTDFAMNDFLAQYGMGLGENVIIDSSTIGQLIGPAAPLVAEYAEHPITRELKRIMTFFPMAQGVTTSSSSLGYETQTLLSTTPHSWGETNLEAEEVSFEEGEDVKGPLYLAVAATRSLEVQEKAGGDQEETEKVAADQKGEEGEKEEDRESRFVLFGDSDFATNAYFRSAANGDLFLMTVSWLAADTDLVAIRPREKQDRRVNLSRRQSRTAFLGMVVFLPLATLLLGINIWYRRR